MQKLLAHLKKTPVVYVTRDIERALGLPLDTEGYFVVTNATNYAKNIAVDRKNVLLIAEDRLLDTWELLEHPATRNFLLGEPYTTYQTAVINILVFKNTPKIERICATNGWSLLNPSAALSATIEEKISQVEWLGDLSHLLPPHQVTLSKDVQFTGTPFILQFNRAHTGSGTILVESREQLTEIQTRFPNRDVRITDYINGSMFTSNNIVLPNTIIVGNINYQITGLLPFTDNRFATIGNDWELPYKLLSKKQTQQYHDIVSAVGNTLRTSGWKGLFGVDIILDEQTGQLYLIEINARQPASTTFESCLQRTVDREQRSIGLTTFDLHLASLLNISNDSIKLIPIDIGAQIVQRVTEKTKHIPQETQKEIETLGYTVIGYDNAEPNSDLLRIQSLDHGFVTNHNTLNNQGKELQNILLQ